MAIGRPHLLQLPKSFSLIFSRAILKFVNLRRAERKAASETPLLLIASIRLTLPIAFSGEIGFVASSSRLTSADVLMMADSIFDFKVARSVSFMVKSLCIVVQGRI